MTATPRYKIHPAIGIARVGNSPDSFYLAPETTGGAPIDCDNAGNPIVQNGQEQPVQRFKDENNCIRRQAARFRVYVYDDASPAGRELKLNDIVTAQGPSRGGGRQYTGTVTDIVWKVYLANKKASWYEFDQLEGEHGYPASQALRNAEITDASRRQKLIIDPGPRSVSLKGRATASFDNAPPSGVPSSSPPADIRPNPITKLGDLRCVQTSDGHNRLLVLGGMGNSGSCKSGPADPSIQSYANND